MKKVRRTPRKIGQDDEDEQQTGSSEDSSPVVRRLQSGSKTFKPKKPSNLRASFAPSSADADDAVARPGEEDTTTTNNNDDPFVTNERKANARKSFITPAKLPYRRSPDPSTDRPSYSADYLAELKQSQQSRPRDLHNSTTSDTSDNDDPSTTPKTLDIASKFGTSDTLLRTSSSTSSSIHPQLAPHIPTDAEIREKKDRRRRLAREEKDFISLNDNNSSHRNRRRSSSSSYSSSSDHGTSRRRDQNESLIIPASSAPTTKTDLDPGSRIGTHALSDDDLAEGFDDFVEDPGRVALGRKARREQDARRRREIAAQIAGAERGVGGGLDDDDGLGGGLRSKGEGDDEDENDDDDDEDQDPDELSRLRAYEAAQTHHGTYSTRHTATTSHTTAADAAKEREERWRRITTTRYKAVPLPTLKGEREKWRRLVEEKRGARREMEMRIEGVRRERIEVEEEERRVGELVREAGERLERLLLRAGEGEGGGEGGAEEEKGKEEEREREREQDGHEVMDVDTGGVGGARGGLGSVSGLGYGSGPGLGRNGVDAIGGRGRGLESFAGLSSLSNSNNDDRVAADE